jgi:DNA-binding NtrC family response regulator
MSTPKQILVVEDDVALAASLLKVLRGEGYVVDHAPSGDRGLKLAGTGSHSLVLTDLRMPGMGGLELVDRLRESKPRLPVIMFTAHGTAETAIEATKRGAYDYLLKPFAMPELLAMIDRVLERTRACRDVVPSPAGNDDGRLVVGSSPSMQGVLKDIGRVASRDMTVLISGETGTGKEVVARTIWRHSGRAGKPFLAINCAAIPETLLESELFGHEKGAFTGADTRRPGRFEQADKGTLFLDEIGDVSPATQVRLLRVLQERTIQRVGGRETIPIDVRVIAATHRDLAREAATGSFREDLYYRLGVVTLHLPALRERPEDIAILATHFAETAARRFGLVFGGLRKDALDRLATHGWPGNVRELENTIHRALLAARGFPISAEIIAEVIAAPVASSGTDGNRTLAEIVDAALQQPTGAEGGQAHATVVEAAEAELLRKAMERAAGNQSRVARWLGISRLTLRDRLRRHRLHPESGPD